MPQLKKVVLAMGNRLIYEDTFEQALSRLSGGAFSMLPPPEVPGGAEEITSAEHPHATAAADWRRIRALAARLTQLRRQAEGLVEEL